MKWDGEPHEISLKEGIYWCDTEDCNADECCDENRCNYDCVCNTREDTCCECGAEDHTCQDCPTFM